MAGLFTKDNSKLLKTAEEIELIRTSCLLVSKTLAHVGSILRPGITGLEIDKAAETFIRDHQARPAFKGYNGFPGTLCISYNDIVVHGIPAKREFKETDIVSVDCGVELNGYFGDSAFTFAFNNVEEPVMDLLGVTLASLYRAIDQAVAGNRIGDISFAVQDFCEREHKYGVVRELVGHGIGQNLHEEPEVPNFGKRGRGPIMKEGLVIAIEPMINLGRKEVYQANDGWTIHTRDRQPSAHYEHTVAVKKQKADILSNHDFVLESVKNNPNLKDISLKN
ncbi:MAG: type I methionyl aminopeptidase [Saprospiraceae bacterium]|jgi:methionyl aminopeptidase